METLEAFGKKLETVSRVRDSCLFWQVRHEILSSVGAQEVPRGGEAAPRQRRQRRRRLGQRGGGGGGGGAQEVRTQNHRHFCRLAPMTNFQLNIAYARTQLG